MNNDPLHDFPHLHHDALRHKGDRIYWQHKHRKLMLGIAILLTDIASVVCMVAAGLSLYALAAGLTAKAYALLFVCFALYVVVVNFGKQRD